MPRVTITTFDGNTQPYRFGMDRELVSFGRSEDNDIVIDCGSVSGVHAEMRRVLGGYELRDLGSTNGIRLNGEYMEVIPLRNHQSVLLGDVVFDFNLSDGELTVLGMELQQPLAALASPAESVSVALPLPRAASPKEWDEPEHSDSAPAKASNSGFLSFVVLVALVAFMLGMSKRYHNETKASLFELVQERISGFIEAAVTKPALEAQPKAESAPE